VKRFVNLYRLARTQAQDGQDHKGALALMLALDAGGTQGEIAAMNDALSGRSGRSASICIRAGCGSPKRSPRLSGAR